MQKFKGFEAKTPTVGQDPLPIGIHIVTILDVQEKPWNNGNGTNIEFAFDVSEGELKGYFSKQYKADTSDYKKWKGTYRITAPDEKSSYFESQRDTFNKTIGAFESSNADYHFNWSPIEKGDWSQLKGKKIGVAYRAKEWEYEGRTGWTTEAAWFLDVNYAKSGNAKIPAPKALRNGSTSQNEKTKSLNDIVEDTNDDLPF